MRLRIHRVFCLFVCADFLYVTSEILTADLLSNAFGTIENITSYDKEPRQLPDCWKSDLQRELEGFIIMNYIILPKIKEKLNKDTVSNYANWFMENMKELCQEGPYQALIKEIPICNETIPFEIMTASQNGKQSHDEVRKKASLLRNFLNDMKTIATSVNEDGLDEIIARANSLGEDRKECMMREVTWIRNGTVYLNEKLGKILAKIDSEIINDPSNIHENLTISRVENNFEYAKGGLSHYCHYIGGKLTFLAYLAKCGIF